MSKTKTIFNDIKLILFTMCLGAVAAAVFWVFMFVMKKGTNLLWEVLPGRFDSFVLYPVVVCTIGGLIMGCIKKKYGDYPESMDVVFGSLKSSGTYDYSKILIILISSLVPLLVGASVGPEAAMVGIITSLCCWAGDNIKSAAFEAREFSKIGSAVTLSVLFCSPLFGFFELEENEEETGTIKKSTKVCMYVVAIGTALGVYKLLNSLCGIVSEGLPQFSTALPKGIDYALMFLYLLLGILFGLFFELTEKGFEKLSARIPKILGGILAGLILGISAIFVPLVQFSGEHELGVLMEQYAMYTPIALIGFSLFKILITNICIQFGLKGGHFFPLIFAAVCLGYGVALMFFPGDVTHAIFAAAITTAAALGITIRKPIAVTALLFLCFPVRMCFWLFFSAGIASFVAGHIHKKPAE